MVSFQNVFRELNEFANKLSKEALLLEEGLLIIIKLMEGRASLEEVTFLYERLVEQRRLYIVVLISICDPSFEYLLGFKPNVVIFDILQQCFFWMYIKSRQFSKSSCLILF
jgi:hypothetical protein